MYYVYLLKSKTNKHIYVGYTGNLKNRYRLHNLGKVKSTKANKPWILIYYEAFRAKFDATKREKELKQHAPKSILMERLKNSVK